MPASNGHSEKTKTKRSSNFANSALSYKYKGNLSKTTQQVFSVKLSFLGHNDCPLRGDNPPFPVKKKYAKNSYLFYLF